MPPTVGMSLRPRPAVVSALLSLVLRSGPAKPVDSIDRIKSLRFMNSSPSCTVMESLNDGILDEPSGP